MVKQGTIIKINFNPQSGHEQAGYRPAVVISNDIFNEKARDLALSFVDFRLDKEPKYSIKECKERDVTYAAPPQLQVCYLQNPKQSLYPEGA